MDLHILLLGLEMIHVLIFPTRTCSLTKNDPQEIGFDFDGGAE